jgi:hypothetical protein
VFEIPFGNRYQHRGRTGFIRTFFMAHQNPERIAMPFLSFFKKKSNVFFQTESLRFGECGQMRIRFLEMVK